MKYLLSATLILLSTLSYAQVPNSFSSGETISSSQINANFSFLADAMARGNVAAIIYCNKGPIFMALFALNVDRLSWICHFVSGTAKSL